MVSDSVSVSCNTGMIGEISHYGVFAKDSEADQRSLCTSEGVSISTGLDCASISKRDHPFFTDKLQSCIGQASCMVTGIHDEIPIGAQPGDAGCNIKEQDSLFIQYSCVVPEDELKQKRQEAMLTASVNIFCGLVLLSVIGYRQGSINIEKREWDLQTVTASDYTLEIKLTKS